MGTDALVIIATRPDRLNAAGRELKPHVRDLDQLAPQADRQPMPPGRQAIQDKLPQLVRSGLDPTRGPVGGHPGARLLGPGGSHLPEEAAVLGGCADADLEVDLDPAGPI